MNIIDELKIRGSKSQELLSWYIIMIILCSIRYGMSNLF